MGTYHQFCPVAKAMELLPPDQRTAILLKEYHGLTFQEIAETMKCPLSTAKTRVYQGLVLLRKHLAEQGQMPRTEKES